MQDTKIKGHADLSTRKKQWRALRLRSDSKSGNQTRDRTGRNKELQHIQAHTSTFCVACTPCRQQDFSFALSLSLSQAQTLPIGRPVFRVARACSQQHARAHQVVRTTARAQHRHRRLHRKPASLPETALPLTKKKARKCYARKVRKTLLRSLCYSRQRRQNCSTVEVATATISRNKTTPNGRRGSSTSTSKHETAAVTTARRYHCRRQKTRFDFVQGHAAVEAKCGVVVNTWAMGWWIKPQIRENTGQRHTNRSTPPRCALSWFLGLTVPQLAYSSIS